MEKVLLLIDDSQDHIGILDNIKSYLLRTESIKLVTKYINPNDREFWNEDKDPDLDNLISGIKTKLNSIKPNLIVIDQYYSGNEKFRGLDVVEKLRTIPKFKECSIYIISGKRVEIVREIFSSKGLSDGDKVNRLAKIISFKIDRFLDKDFKSEAIDHLKQAKLNEILPTKLREYEDENATVNCFSPKYRTIAFSELADKIEGNSLDAQEILDEMFELTLSHYVSINEKL